jgi:hypothetical protein
LLLRQGSFAQVLFRALPIATTSPSDSHFRQLLALFLPLALCGFTHHQSGSPKFLGALSVRAARLYPGESVGWFRSPFQPPMPASHLLSCLATPGFGFEASDADSLSLRLAPSQARGFSRPLTQPPARSASCVMTLTWLTPFSQREHAKLLGAPEGNKVSKDKTSSLSIIRTVTGPCRLDIPAAAGCRVSADRLCFLCFLLFKFSSSLPFVNRAWLVVAASSPLTFDEVSDPIVVKTF